MASSSKPHIYLVYGEISVLLPLPETWAVASLNPDYSHLIGCAQNLREFSEEEFGVAPRYVEFRAILDGQPSTSRASEPGWQELRKDLERGWDGSKKPVIRITMSGG